MNPNSFGLLVTCLPKRVPSLARQYHASKDRPSHGPARHPQSSLALSRGRSAVMTWYKPAIPHARPAPSEISPPRVCPTSGADHRPCLALLALGIRTILRKLPGGSRASGPLLRGQSNLMRALIARDSPRAGRLNDT